MTTTTSTPDAVASLRERAAAIVQAAAPLDVPRLVLVPEHDSRRGGSCVGSGHRLAIAHGHPGAVAVRVDADTPWVRWAAVVGKTEDDTKVATILALADVVVVAAHEVAHSLDAPLDAPADADMAHSWVARARDLDENLEVAQYHRARWASLFTAIMMRCQRHVSRAVARYMCREAAASIGRYGFDHRLLRRAAGAVPMAVPLREHFASGSPACRRLSAASPTDAERAMAIAVWRAPRATP